ncbi:MAG: type II toxin-antitoxin system RelE/ParE family toxin [Patescibacteria group bacterium]
MQIYITKPAQKDLDRLPNKIVVKIGMEIQKLANNPYPPNSKKLQFRDNTYRIRLGDYRAVYEVDVPDKKIHVVKIRHRKDVYR